MAFTLCDWTWETTTTTGTGAYSLAGAVTNYRAFSAGLSNGDTTYVSVFDGTNFEEGLYTYTSSTNTLARTTVYRSTNSNNAVNWGVGTKQIMAAQLGITLQSFLTPGSTGFPNRSADNTWSYYNTSGSGTTVPLATGATLTGPTLAAGTASVAPLTLTSGTNLTNAAAGAVEYDGTVFYNTNNANNRGLFPSVQYAIFNNTTYTLANQTAAQKLFNTSTNGAITLPTGIFEFEIFFTLSSMSTTSGTFGMALAGTATYTQTWEISAIKNTIASQANPSVSYLTAASITSLTGNSIVQTAYARAKGVIRVTVSGTFIPQVSLTQAAAAVVGANSYCKITQIANTSTQTIGNWS